MGTYKGIRIAKEIFKKNQAEGLTLTDLKMYFKSSLLKEWK